MSDAPDASSAASSESVSAEQPSAVPSVVRRLASPAALALADLAGVFEDLQTVLRCCERLVNELARESAVGGEPDDLALEAYWTTAVLSYGRCFSAGPRGTGLTEDDITATGLAGDVLGWHRILLQQRDRCSHPVVNPRETFSVGAAQDVSGHAEGIAVASTRQPSVDEVSVRQTGAIAYALSARLDEQIAAQQAVVFAAVAAMARPALDKLAVLHLTGPEGAGRD